METEELATILAGFKNDPLGFVLWAYPWGEAGTELEDEYPDRWQVAVLNDIKLALELNEKLPKEERTPVQVAIASGHGIGKTALMAWIDQWFISTRNNARIVTTANTFSQLTGKTWAELYKWHKLMVHRHLLQWRAEKYFMKENPAEWKSDAVPWSKHNSEAFAGTHAKSVLYKFDEGSAIDDIIYEVSEGAMTTEDCIWIVFGNPTRNTGRFRACFGKFRHRWITRSIDSRTARKTNKAKIRQWIEDYGEDSDFVRVRVKGKFPRYASGQLVSEDQMDFCMKLYESIGYEIYPISICCDVARSGDDLTTVGAWQKDFCHELKGYPKESNSKKSVVQTASHVAECYRHYKQKYPYAKIRCFVDDDGVGGGVTDILESWGIPVTGVQSGATEVMGDDDRKRFLNMRAKMWWLAGQAIANGYDLRNADQRLKDDMVNMTYWHQPGNMKIQMEAVDDLKARGLPSPDYGTNFVLQFAFPQLLDIIDASQQNQQRNRGGSTTMQKRREQGYGNQNNTDRGRPR